MYKQQLLDLIEQSYRINGRGFYLGERDGFRAYADLDGKHAREFLEALGFEVVSNVDTGTRGRVQTACGLDLSTNGHISRVQP